jgi:hypothetical protein
MMHTIDGKTFESFYDQESSALFSDFELRHCCFESCALSMTSVPSRRSTVRNVRLFDCAERGCRLDAAVLEDVLVSGLKTHGQLLQTFGAVFNKVSLRGKIDRLMISNDVLPSILMDETDRQSIIAKFRRANAEYYQNIEWAVDISGGQFKELDIRGIPAALIRRDPETQIVITRQIAEQGAWRELAFKETLWRTWIEHFLHTDESDTVLVAPKLHPKFRNYLDDIRLLREAGIAEAN